MIEDYGEAAALDALHREEQRLRGEQPARPEPSWEPEHPLALAIWKALPESGRGLEYVMFVRSIAGGQWPLWHVQQVILGLVLVGKAYVAPAPTGGDASIVGRGADSRVGAAAYRVGTFGGLG